MVDIIYKESTQEIVESVSVETGSSETTYLYAGDYTIKGYDSEGDFIGSIYFVLEPNAEGFSITIFPYQVTAKST